MANIQKEEDAVLLSDIIPGERMLEIKKSNIHYYRVIRRLELRYRLEADKYNSDLSVLQGHRMRLGLEERGGP